MKEQIIFLVGLISIFIFLSTAQAQYPEIPQPQSIFNFFFRIYNNDIVELIKLEPAVGYPLSSAIGDYKVRIISTDKKILNESKVDILFLYNKTKSNGVLVNASIREFVDVYLSLPYYSEASRIELYHFDRLIYQKEIPTELPLDTCGNGFCDLGENDENCPQDCFAAATTTIPKTTTTLAQGKESKYSLFLIIISVLLILIVVFILIYKMYRP